MANIFKGFKQVTAQAYKDAPNKVGYLWFVSTDNPVTGLEAQKGYDIYLGTRHYGHFVEGELDKVREVLGLIKTSIGLKDDYSFSNADAIVSGATSVDAAITKICNEIDTKAVDIKYTKRGDDGKAYLQLLNKAGETIGTKLDVTDFVVDGILESVVFSEEPGKENTLVFTWNTDAGKTETEIDFTKYIDIYTAGNGLNLSALASGREFSIKLDETAEDKYLKVDEKGLRTEGIGNAIAKASTTVSAKVEDPQFIKVEAVVDPNDNHTNYEISTNDIAQKSVTDNITGQADKYVPMDKTQFISGATCLNAADVLLDKALETVIASAGLNKDGTFPTEDLKDYLYLAESSSVIQNDTLLLEAIAKLTGYKTKEYTPNAGTNYISGDTINSLNAADIQLDKSLKAEETRAREAESLNAKECLKYVLQLKSMDKAIRGGAGLEDDGTYLKDDTTFYLKEATSLKDADNKLDKKLNEQETKNINIQKELDDTQAGAGLSEAGAYVQTSGATYIKDASSLNDADIKLDSALNTEETSRKAIEGQSGSTYAAISGATYIKTASNLTDADKILDETLKAKSDELDKVEKAVGLAEDGTFVKFVKDTDGTEYVNDAVSHRDAEVKLDKALKAAEDKRVAITGQATEKYVPNTQEAVKYIKEAKSLNDADVILDNKLYIEQEARKTADSNLQTELDATQTGAGLSAEGTYVQTTGATFIKEASSLNDADVKLDAALNAEVTARRAQTGISGDTYQPTKEEGADVIFTADSLMKADLLLAKEVKAGNKDLGDKLAEEIQARKDVDGQSGQTYTANTTVDEKDPITYISGATNLNDADVKLDKALKAAEDRRIAITGQEGDEYVPYKEISHYLKTATSLHDADRLLDEAIFGKVASLKSTDNGILVISDGPSEEKDLAISLNLEKPDESSKAMPQGHIQITENGNGLYGLMRYNGSQKEVVSFWRGTRSEYNQIGTTTAGYDAWTRYSVLELDGSWSEYFGTEVISSGDGGSSSIPTPVKQPGEVFPANKIVYSDAEIERKDGMRAVIQEGGKYYIAQVVETVLPDGTSTFEVKKEPMQPGMSVRLKDKGYMAYVMTDDGKLVTYDDGAGPAGGVDCGSY